MEQNKLAAYAQSNPKEVEKALEVIEHKIRTLLDNDLNASQHIGDLWRATIEIQTKLNQIYAKMLEKEEESGSGKGSGQVKLKEAAPERIAESAQVAAQEPQMQFKPKTLAEVANNITAQVAAMRGSTSNQAISQPSSANRPGR